MFKTKTVYGFEKSVEVPKVSIFCKVKLSAKAKAHTASYDDPAASNPKGGS